MARFLIEVPHEAERVACARVVEIRLKTGSHLPDGCGLGAEHKAWIDAEVDSKEEARSILSPPPRSQAKIVQLSYFALEEVEAILRYHQVSRQQPQRWHPRVEEEGGVHDISQ